MREVWARYLPNKITAQTTEGDARSAEVSPLLRDRPMLNGRPTAYVCERYTCQAPTNSTVELGRQLSDNATLDASGKL
jgi:uncharacterized protein YyaL (SSP411 family)